MKKEKKKETKERKPNWKDYMASVDDIKAFLSDRIYLRHNVITGRVECRIPERDYFDDSDLQPDSGGETLASPSKSSQLFTRKRMWQHWLSTK